MKTIIIEDKKESREYLESLLANFNEINYIGNADTVKEGIALIKETNPDLVLFDIELPDGESFDILKSFESWEFKMIFITSHDSYAIKAFKYNAIDYLLKPLEQKAFSEAINKALTQNKLENQDVQVKMLLNSIGFPQQEEEKIVLNTADHIHILEIKQIIRCESEDTYTYFFLNDGRKLLISTNLKEYEIMFSSHGFLRVHRSHLVNKKHIKTFNKKQGELIMSNDNEVPVSQRKREILTQSLKGQQSI